MTYGTYNWVMDIEKVVSKKTHIFGNQYLVRNLKCDGEYHWGWTILHEVYRAEECDCE